MPEAQGRPLPKFGEWDVNDPASAEGFTVIFNQFSDERKGGNTPGPELLGREEPSYNKDRDANVTNKPSSTKKWFCCIKPSPAKS